MAERDWLEAVVAALEDGRPVREVPVPAEAGTRRGSCRLTSKPILYVANVDEGSHEVPGAVAAYAQGAGATAVSVSARIESELAEIGDSPRPPSCRPSSGSRGVRARRMIHAAFSLLDLITFFTAGEDKEAMARNVRRGSTAWEAAGKIHGHQGGLRTRRGGRLGRPRGRRRLRGCPRARQAAPRGPRYVMADGDVMTVKF